MRTPFAACIVLAACASGTKEAPAPAATVMAGSMPAEAPAPEARSRPEPAAAATTPSAATPAPPADTAPAAQNHGPVTAAEAAAAASAQRTGGAGDAPATPAASEDAPCTTDVDCSFTRLSPGACCPMLCTPRAVTAKAAEALEAHVRTCAMGNRCPQPMCMPPRQMTYPACVQNKCVAKVREGAGPD